LIEPAAPRNAALSLPGHRRTGFTTGQQPAPDRQVTEHRAARGLPVTTDYQNPPGNLFPE